MIVQATTQGGIVTQKLIGIQQQFVLVTVEMESKFKMKLVTMGTILMETDALLIV